MRYAHKKQIAVHCTDTLPLMRYNMAVVRSWHTSPPPHGRGWSDVGYAYLILPDGTFELGRDVDRDGDVLEETGAHVAYHNKKTIGICLVGGRDKDGKPANNFTAAQFKTLAWLLGEISTIIPGIEVLGHRDFPGVKKACPCFDVKSWWTEHQTGYKEVLL